MSNEPTEEQKQAAREACWSLNGSLHHNVARLLAEREAKLEEHIKWLETQCVSFEDANINNQKTIKALNEENQRYCEQVAIEKRHWSNLNKANAKTEAERDTLRARVAELEASRDHPRTWAAVEAREAQHLADIRALMGCCRGLVHDVDRLMCGIDVGRHAMVMRATLQRLAHYDDAKSDAPAVAEERCTRCLEPYSRDNWCAENGHDVPREALGDPDVDPSQDVTFPAECPKCQEGTRPFYDFEQARWLCDRCHHPAGEPFVHDAEGGEG